MSRIYNIFPILLVILAIVFIGLIVTSTYTFNNAKERCDNKDGVLLKGTLGWVCVKSDILIGTE